MPAVTSLTELINPASVNRYRFADLGAVGQNFSQDWTKTSKNNPCPICGKTDWCSISGTAVKCMRVDDAPIGWKRIKDTTDGGGVFVAITKINISYQPEQSLAAVKPQSLPELSATAKDAEYRQATARFGRMGSVYRQELQRRGLSNEQIDWVESQQWLGNWAFGANLPLDQALPGIHPTTGKTVGGEGMAIPALNVHGQIIGYQIYNRKAIELRLAEQPLGEETKYYWLSSAKYDGNSPKIGAEMPLTIWQHPDSTPTIAIYTEGFLKSLITALKLWEQGLTHVAVIGAASGNFGAVQLTEIIDQLPTINRHILAPDSGAQENKTILANYSRLAENLEALAQTLEIGWWGQYKKSSPDVDELRHDQYQQLLERTISIDRYRVMCGNKWPLQTNSTIPITPNLRINTPFNGEEFWAAIPETANLIGIKGGWGTGKTRECLSQVVKHNQDIGKPTIVIVHRRELARDIARALGMPYLDDLEQSPVGKALGFVLCIDSLHGNSRAAFDWQDWADADVIIDEVEQVIWHLLNSSTCRDNQAAILTQLSNLLTELIIAGNKVYVADADLSRKASKFLTGLIGMAEHSPVVRKWTIESTYQPDTSQQKRALFYDIKQNFQQALENSLRAKKRLLIQTTAKSESSKLSSKQVFTLVGTLWPEARIMLLDGDTAHDPNHPAFLAKQDLSKAMQEYDVVICTTVIESGVSISPVNDQGEAINGCDEVFIYLTGHTPVNSAAQFANRLRRPVTRHIFAPKQANYARIGNGSSDPRAWLRGEFKKSEYMAASIPEILQDIANAESSGLMGVATEYATEINAGLKNYAEQLKLRLADGGWFLDVPEEPDDEYETTDLKELGKQLAKAEDLAILDAVNLSQEEFERLDKANDLTTDERRALKKAKAKKIYGIEPSEELLDIDRQGMYPKLKLLYLLGTQQAEKRDREVLSEWGDKRPTINHINRTLKSGTAKALVELGIVDLLNWEEEYTNESLQSWLESIINEPEKLELLEMLRLTAFKQFNDGCVPKSAIELLGDLIRKLGLKFKCIRREGSRGDRTRVYQLDALTDLQKQILTAWLVKDGLAADFIVHLNELKN